MTRVDVDAPFRLSQDSWTLVFNGLNVNQDLIISAGDESQVLSDPDADLSAFPYLFFVPGNRLAFHVDLSQVPGNTANFSFQIIARNDAFVSWSMRSPEGTHFDSEGLRVFRGSHIEVLEISRSANWEIRSRKSEVGIELTPLKGNKRLPNSLRELHRLAGNLLLAEGATNVAVVVDSSASMLKIQHHKNFHNLLEALRAISLAVSLSPLKIRFAGITEPIEIGPLDTISAEIDRDVLKGQHEFREVEPMMSLVPGVVEEGKLLKPGGKLFCVSDTWFFMGKELAAALERLDLEIVLIKILDHESEDEPVRFQHPRVRIRTIIGLEHLDSPTQILRELA